MSCYGCEQNMANQLAHMDFGGCLYIERPIVIATPPPSPVLVTETPLVESAPEFFPLNPVACAVCATEVYFGEMAAVRRASDEMVCCQDHRGKCAYCGQTECSDTAILCEPCSYSGAGNAFIVEAFNQEHTFCLYDKNPSSQEAWECGCSRCIQSVAALYQASSVNPELAFSL
jgi:hypothetical protein